MVFDCGEKILDRNPDHDLEGLAKLDVRRTLDWMVEQERLRTWYHGGELGCGFDPMVHGTQYEPSYSENARMSKKRKEVMSRTKSGTVITSMKVVLNFKSKGPAKPEDES